MNIKQLQEKVNVLKKQVEELQSQIAEDTTDDFLLDGCGFYFDFGVRRHDICSLPFSELQYFNRFKDRDKAEQMTRHINAVLAMYHIAEYLNDGWKPDWKNEDEKKHCIYGNGDGSVGISCIQRRISPEFCFKTKELAERAIKMLKSKNMIDDYFMIWEKTK